MEVLAAVTLSLRAFEENLSLTLLGPGGFRHSLACGFITPSASWSHCLLLFCLCLLSYKNTYHWIYGPLSKPG